VYVSISLHNTICRVFDEPSIARVEDQRVRTSRTRILLRLLLRGAFTSVALSGEPCVAWLLSCEVCVLPDERLSTL
jgi:hypothetical protein